MYTNYSNNAVLYTYHYHINDTWFLVFINNIYNYIDRIEANNVYFDIILNINLKLLVVEECIAHNI